LGAEKYEACIPVIEYMDGWTDVTRGVTELDKLPANAIAYIKRLEELVGVEISIISTGPERNETIVLDNPFD
ncbi:MAG: adenylosuccinate synthase, partial [Methyloprofundus sp.]|nr:adenylosuccinate synthase [Methyloprofundus sp.]